MTKKSTTARDDARPPKTDQPETAADAVQDRKERYRGMWSTQSDISALARKMAQVQKRKEELEDSLKEANAAFDVLRLELIPKRMEEQGDLQSMTIRNLGRLSLTPDVHVSIKAEMKDRLFAWLKKRRLGDLMQTTVNSGTLRAFVKDRTKNGKEIPIACLNVSPYIRASITKS